MLTIQGIYCGATTGNTGVGKCGVDLTQLEGFILMDSSKTYNPATYADQAAFFTALQADALLANKTNRIYPMLYVDGVVDATADNSIKETVYGKQVDVAHEQPRWTITLEERGMRQVGQLDKWRKNKNAAIVPVFKGGNGNSLILFQKTAAGLYAPLSCFVYGNKIGLGAKNPADKSITVAFNDFDIFFGDNLVFYATSAGTKLKYNLHGIHDLTINIVSATTTNIIFELFDASTGEIMGESYETALELAGAFLLNLVSTGATVAISSTAWNAVTKQFTSAGTITAAAHVFTMADPTTLAALSTPFGNGITGGFESNIVTVTPA